jgi:hypothetical protein
MMSDPPRLRETPKRSTVEKILGHLCTGALKKYWVLEHGRPLMGLDCVRAYAGSRSTEDDLAAALVEYLEDAVQRVDSPQNRRLLEVVLGLGEADWRAESWREKTATERRAKAGRTFRGADARAVTFGTIRQHHEPKAIYDLATIVLADEKHARKSLPS